MKTVRFFSAIAAAFLLLASSQVAKAADPAITDVVSKLTSSNGIAAGSALLGLYNQFKADGKFDIKNANNITNLLKLATNIKGLKDQPQTSNSGFLTGLISGSKNLVNNNNSSTVLSSLTKLSGLDLSSLGNSVASTAASSLLKKATGKTTTPTTNANTDKAASILSSLFSVIKK